MRHLDNIYNPDKPDAKQLIKTRSGQTPEEAWAQQERWLSGKTIGRPKATEHYTVEQLEAMGMVGVYVEDENQ